MSDTSDPSLKEEISIDIASKPEGGSFLDENEELRLLSFTPGIVRLLEQGRIQGRRIIQTDNSEEVSPYVRELIREGMFDPDFAADILDSISRHGNPLSEDQISEFWERVKMMRNVMVAMIGSCAMDYMEYVLEHNGKPPRSLNIFGTELPIKSASKTEEGEIKGAKRGVGYDDIAKHSESLSTGDDYTWEDITHIKDGLAELFREYYNALDTIFYSIAFGLSHDNPIWIMANNFSRLVHIGNSIGATQQEITYTRMNSSKFILRGFGTFVQVLKNILEVAYYNSPSRNEVKSVFSKSWGACLVLAKGDLNIRPYAMSKLLEEGPKDDFGTPTSKTQTLLKVESGRVVVNTGNLEKADRHARENADKMVRQGHIPKRGNPRVVTYCPGLTNVNGKGSMIKRGYAIANKILARM